jgi:hypothetical protein
MRRWLVSFKICLWSTLFLILVFSWNAISAHAEGKGERRIYAKIIGEVKMGETFEKAFGPAFYFRLEPNAYGWLITLRDERGSEDLSRLTPPFHFVPNPREIEGWHFRNSDNSGPNEPGEKNVNAPGLIREFIFSPEVGRTIDGPNAKRKPTLEEIEKIQRFGRGELRILDYKLGDLVPGKRARFEWMRFEVDLSWPVGKKGD